MILPSWIFFVTFLTATTMAFYPIRQHRDQDTVTLPQNGNQNKRTPHPVKVLMKRKAASSQLNPYDWTSAQINAVKRRRQDQPQLEHERPVKRENNYNVLTAATPTQTNSVAIDEDGTDFSYFASVYFGSKRTMMFMLVDSGAANTWVMGSNCTSDACNKHNTFGPADSATFQSIGDHFNLTYGTGTVSGNTINDTMEIAGISIPLSFGMASTTSDDFLDYPMDGILGLGRSASNTMKFPTVMQAMKASDKLPANVFGVNIQRQSDGSMDGELSFGAPDEAKFTGELSFSHTVPDGKYWEIPIDDASYQGNRCKFTGKSAVIDTGTTYILLPPDDAKSLHSQIPGSSQDGELFHVPCSLKEPIQIFISGVPYNITPADFIGKQLKGGSLCESNIIGMQAFEEGQWLLGDVFLKNVYTLFDIDRNRIGFGIKTKTSPKPSSFTSELSTVASTGSSGQVSATDTASTTAVHPGGQALISPSPVSLKLPSASAANPSRSNTSSAESLLLAPTCLDILFAMLLCTYLNI